MKKKQRKILIIVGIAAGIVLVVALVARSKDTDATSESNDESVGACLYEDHCDLMAVSDDQPALCQSLGGSWQGAGSVCP